MRILCDQNAPAKYVAALQRVDGITATTVDEVLRHDATDVEIARFAEDNGWVVFTNDDDFFVAGGDHGLLLYDQVEDPASGDVVAAVEAISRAYQSHSEIVESVPGDWV
ncbi:DUF5615 family PIN-like protein [Haloarcula sp. JP-L23]|uniref:DUF5615 family PIN-like protein n=1 Tax=Haloarcula sp. JP-L23 TaxID=2716717 RepID=UPI00140F1B53|nr:DUF5615 family PIN-like protein [Haloarcula sp. JP-L23]